MVIYITSGGQWLANRAKGENAVADDQQYHPADSIRPDDMDRLDRRRWEGGPGGDKRSACHHPAGRLRG